MGMASKLKDLRALNDDELIKPHDEEAVQTVVGTQYYMDELARGESMRTTNIIRSDTAWVKWLTIAVAVMTAVNVVLVAVSVSR